MARTRAQATGEAEESATATSAKAEPEKKGAKRSKGENNQQASKKAKTAMSGDSENDHEATAPAKAGNVKIDQVISKYGTQSPFHNLEDPNSSTADTILAHLLNATLSSARISHAIAAKTVECVLQAGYHNLATLKASTWQERTEVLTEGGYTHYREKTATALGELAAFIEEQHDGDLNNIVTHANSDPKKIRAALKEIKGLGDVGIGIFFNTVQHLWTCVAPALDARSTNTAEAIGIGSDVNTVWEAAGKDPERMSKLAMALTEVRLQKAEKEFT